MTPTERLAPEAYVISPRFFRAMQAKALMLEIDALRDELGASTMDDPGQITRHRRLIQAQRDEADRLRDFLKRTTVRTEAQS